MQLLEHSQLYVFATIFVVCALLAVILTAVAWRISRQIVYVLPLFVSAFAFALLGFVTGSIMAHSRESAVGAVLPAVLTLLGGVAIYLIGTRGHEKQIIVSALVIAFTSALYIGSSYGARLRYDFEIAVSNPILLRQRDLALEQNRHVVEVQRLLNYIELRKLERDFSKVEGLDLSLFESASERRAAERKQSDVKATIPAKN